MLTVKGGQGKDLCLLHGGGVLASTGRVMAANFLSGPVPKLGELCATFQWDKVLESPAAPQSGGLGPHLGFPE